MSEPISIKRGDTDPPVQATLSGLGIPPLPSGAAVRFRLWRVGATTTTVDAPATVDDAAQGQVSYRWQAGDTDVAGSYEADWVLSWEDEGGKAHQETFPNDDSQIVRIVDHGGV